jgi:hypothetical protein
MAKSTNHTAHNQSYKNHRNGACCPRPSAPRGVDPGEARVVSRHRETLAARDIHFSRERPTTAWCLRLLRRERPRIRREVFGNAMMHSIASRRRAAWLASQPGPAASSRIGFSRL